MSGHYTTNIMLMKCQKLIFWLDDQRNENNQMCKYEFYGKMMCVCVFVV